MNGSDLAPDVGRLRGGRRRLHPVAWFIVRRIAAGILTLLVVSVLVFGAVQVLPGDVAQVVLGRAATPHLLEIVRADLHLNESVPLRYLHWLKGMLTGEFGDSYAALAQGTTLPVWEAIRTPLLNSLLLATLTIVIFIPVCLLLATVAALRAGRATDQGISMVSLSLSSMPEFLVGTLLILIFFSGLDLLPPVSVIPRGQSPLGHPADLVLPVLTLLGVSVAFGTRLLRASIIEVLREDYVAMARLNGIRERRVIWRYALRNALAPSMQVLAQMVQYLVGGIIIVESVFNYPGIGTTLVQAVMVRDQQEVAVVTMILAAIYVSLNVLADLAVVLLVPRLRTQM